MVVAAALTLFAAGADACHATPVEPTPQAQVLLRDDFDGAALDPGIWGVPTGAGTFLGRTQIRPPSEPPVVSNGLLHLRLDTFNPTAQTPGDSFWGSEIVTRATFERGTGLAFRARVRLVEAVAGGMVVSLFSYVTRGQIRDEIDFEILTNDVVRSQRRILTNVFSDDPFTVAGRPHFVALTDAPTTFTELEVQWLPDRIRWLVNRVVLREEAAPVPDEPMSIRLNFWAADENFADAFDAALQPAARAVDNRTYFYEIDFAEVRRLQ
jgi:beta-glucanase (GH16 family)